MSRKKKVPVKQRGSLEVKSEFAGAHAESIAVIGADVDVPRGGSQKVETKVGTLVIDRHGLLIGAVVHGGEEDES